MSTATAEDQPQQQQLPPLAVNQRPKRRASNATNDSDSAPSEAKKARKANSNVDQPPEAVPDQDAQNDSFCWVCHKEGDVICCETCPRVFHLKCVQLEEAPAGSDNWVCPECILVMTAENMDTRSRAMRLLTVDQLCTLLKYALARIRSISGVEPFLKPVNPGDFPAYRKYVSHPQDLLSVEKNVKAKQYGSTEAFFSDVKWILHNCIIFNSPSSKLTSIAKTVIKVSKHEMQEIENCPDCYANAHNKKESWFIMACRIPHIVVWAKLKGFPFWPGKVMRVNSDEQVDVRFFGAHDRAWIPVKDVFLYSEEPPQGSVKTSKKKSNLEGCVQELEEYLINARERFGSFEYATQRTQLDPAKEEEQLKLLYPDCKLPFELNSSRRRERAYSFSGSERSNAATPTPKAFQDSDQESSSDIERSSAEAPRSPVKSPSAAAATAAVTVPPIKLSITQKPTGLEVTKPQDPAASGDLKIIISKKSIVSSAAPKSPSKSSKQPMLTSPVSTEVSATPAPIMTTKNSGKAAEPVELCENDFEEGEAAKKAAAAALASSSVLEDAKRTSASPPCEVSSTTKNKEEKDKPVLIQETEISDTREKVELMSREKPEEKEEDLEEIPTMEIQPGRVAAEKSPPKTSKIVIKLSSNSPAKEKEEEKMEVDSEDAKAETKRQSTESVESKEDAKDEGGKKEVVNAIQVTVPAMSEEEEVTEEESESTDQEDNAKDPRVVDTSRLFASGVSVTVIKDKKEQQKEETKTTEAAASTETTSTNKVVAEIGFSSDISVTVIPKKKEGEKSKEEEAKTASVCPPKSDPATATSETGGSRPSSTASSMDSDSKAAAGRPMIRLKKDSELFTASPANIQAKRPSTDKTSKQVVEIVGEVSKKQPPHPLNPGLTISKVSSHPQPHQQPPIPSSSPANNSRGSTPSSSTSSSGGHPNHPLNVNRNSLASAAAVAASMAASAQSAGGPLAHLLSGITTLASSASAPTNQHPRMSAPSPRSMLNNGPTPPGHIRPPPRPHMPPGGPIRPPMRGPPSGPGGLPSLHPRPPVSLPGAGIPQPPPVCGPVSDQLNRVSTKLVDFMRGTLEDIFRELAAQGSPEGQVKSLQLELERTTWRHQQELAELHRNNELRLVELQRSLNAEKDKIVADVRKAAEIEKQKAVAETKKKQWCANCGKEAILYCCWNTSYCDYPCQSSHWPSHMSTCAQNQSNQEDQEGNGGNDSQQQQQQYQPPASAAEPRFHHERLERERMAAAAMGLHPGSRGPPGPPRPPHPPGHPGIPPMPPMGPMGVNPRLMSQFGLRAPMQRFPGYGNIF